MKNRKTEKDKDRSKRVFIIAEIGINHNGNLDIAKKLIDGAVAAGSDAVKFQKRTVEKVYTKKELDKYRESSWGTTNREQKLGLEFEAAEYDEIDRYCKQKQIHWFASAWDIESQLFLRNYDCDYNKVASAMLTDEELLKEVASEKKHTFISTGMSTIQEIKNAVAIFLQADCSYELMHCNSTYPCKTEDANLNVMATLKEEFQCPIGYSSHHIGIIIPCAATAMGASSIEAHITLDRAMYGSDQPASIEIGGFMRLITYIRTIEAAMGKSSKIVTAEEEAIKAKLRKK